MTDNSKAKIILWVNATMFDRSIGPSRNAECDWTVVSLLLYNYISEISLW